MADDDERALLGRTVERFAATEIAGAVAELEARDPPPRVAEGIAELGLFELDASDEGRPLLVAALRPLARHAAAPAVRVLANAAARSVAGDASPAGVAGFPVYADPSATEGALSRSGGVLSGRVPLVVGALDAGWVALPVLGGGFAVVERERLEVAPAARTLGMRGGGAADVTARDVDDSAWVSGAAYPGALRGPVAAVLAGIVHASVEVAVAYAADRWQGGRPILEHEQVRAMLADMIADLALCEAVAERLGDALPADALAAGLLLRAKEAALRATDTGVQVLGGYGYMEDQPQARHMRDARQAVSLLGRPDLHRQDLVASWLSG